MSNLAKTQKKPFFSSSLVFFYIVVFVFTIVVVNYFNVFKRDIVSIEQMHPGWLVLAIIFQLGTYYFNALIYQFLLQAYTHKKIFSLKELLKTSVVMLFLNQLVPSAGITGNAFFSKMLLKKGVVVEKSLSMMVLVLLTSYLSMIMIILALFFIGPFFRISAYFFPLLLIGMAVFGVLSGLTALIGREKTIESIVNKLSRFSFIKRAIKKYESYTKLIKNKKVNKTVSIKTPYALRAILSKIGLVACDVLTIYALFAGFGVSINIIAVAFGYILTQIVAMIPVSPGALVIYEGGMIFFFTALGVPVEAAVTVVLLYRFLSFWLPMPFGFLLYRNLQKNL